jgi:hypothetical protein
VTISAIAIALLEFFWRTRGLSHGWPIHHDGTARLASPSDGDMD